MRNKSIEKIDSKYSLKNTDSDKPRESTESFIINRRNIIAPNEGAGSFASLTLPKYKRAFLVGLMISAVQQLSGINLIIFYSNQIFNNRHLSSVFTIILGLINVMSTFFSMYMLRNGERK